MIRLLLLLVLLSVPAYAKLLHGHGSTQNSNPPAAFLSVSPTSISPGSSVTVSWSSGNADNCTGFGGFSTGGASSGSASASPITNTTYGLSCVNTVGVASATAALTVSQTNIVNANGACEGAHAGTSLDPYPFQCIVDAINGLPMGGGTVIVGNGVWQTSTTYTISRGNFNLVGNSLSAVISFTGSNWVWITHSGGIPSVRISNLTIDGSLYTEGFVNGLRLSGLQNSTISGNTILGDQDNGLALVLVEGGSDNNVVGNSFDPNTVNGFANCIQINPLGGTANSGLLFEGGTFNSSGLLIIGINAALIHNNSFNNTASGASLGLQTATTLGAPGANGSDGLIIDNNTMDATTGSPNLAFMSQIPQDPGITTDVYNITFSNNTITSTNSQIALQDYQDSCLASCNPLPNNFNAKILNNTLTSAFTGSTIRIEGGTNGAVYNPIVRGNVLHGAMGDPNQILQDAHTFNATVIGNIL